MGINAIILAAGKGTRMKSALPKVIHQISGVPMVEKVVRVLEKANVDNIIIITGHEAEIIENHFDKNRVSFVRQNEQLGTAHAVMQASSLLEKENGKTLILTGDTPLLKSETLVKLLNKGDNYNGVVLTTIQENPTGYGRIIRNDKNNVIDIIEEKDANETQKNIKEVNSGIFCFDNLSLFSLLKKVNNENSQGEYYLTDLVSIFTNDKKNFSFLTTLDNFEVMGINDRLQLNIAENYNQEMIKKRHMLNGVTFLQSNSTFIEEDVMIENDVVIEGNVCLKGKTLIKKGTSIGFGSEIKDSVIESNCVIKQSVIHDSFIGERVSIGPFAQIRPFSTIEDDVKVGNFVEIKKSNIGKNSKIPHLSYIGDSDIGKNVNVGCGAITVNYDGADKHKTTIKDGAFIGCNVNLIAPVIIGEDAIIAAGSTITLDVPDNSLSIARERQINKENYKKKTPQKR